MMRPQAELVGWGWASALIRPHRRRLKAPARHATRHLQQDSPQPTAFDCFAQKFPVWRLTQPRFLPPGWRRRTAASLCAGRLERADGGGARLWGAYLIDELVDDVPNPLVGPDRRTALSHCKHQSAGGIHSRRYTRALRSAHDTRAAWCSMEVVCHR